jgi:hypothetical protein
VLEDLRFTPASLGAIRGLAIRIHAAPTCPVRFQRLDSTTRRSAFHHS